MTYDEFRDALKRGNISNLLFFTGEELYLSDFCVKLVHKSLIRPEVDEFNYICYNDAPELEEASAFINSVPLMSEKKLAVFNYCGLFSNALPEQERWVDMLKHIPPTATVIIREIPEESKKKKSGSPGGGSSVKRAVKKLSQTVEFEYLKAARLNPWLVRAAASLGKSLSARDAAYITGEVGCSMAALHSEIEKICAKAEGFEITRKDIDSVIVSPLVDDVFKLIDAILCSRIDRAYKIVSVLREKNESPVAIIIVMAQQILLVYRAKLMLLQKQSTTAVIRALGGTYPAEKAVKNAPKKTLPELERLIAALKDADCGAKSGAIDGWCALDLVLLAG